jgi:hypothetical protein
MTEGDHEDYSACGDNRSDPHPSGFPSAFDHASGSHAAEWQVALIDKDGSRSTAIGVLPGLRHMPDRYRFPGVILALATRLGGITGDIRKGSARLGCVRSNRACRFDPAWNKGF